MVLIFNQLKSYLAYIVMRPCFLIEGGHYLIQQESHPSIYKANTFFSLFFCFFTFCGRRGVSIYIACLALQPERIPSFMDV
jgi:hypothetical protein